MEKFMGRMTFEYLPGATPLDPDESAGLIPQHITMQAQLNEWEQHNILEAEKWMIGKRFSLKKIATRDFICSLHGRMFGNTWKWAGKFRQSNKNIGVDSSLFKRQWKTCTVNDGYFFIIARLCSIFLGRSSVDDVTNRYSKKLY